MARPDYCPVGNEPCQSMCDEPCSWQGSTRKDDTVLIRQLVEALGQSSPNTDASYAWQSESWVSKRAAAIAAGRSRLKEIAQ